MVESSVDNVHRLVRDHTDLGDGSSKLQRLVNVTARVRKSLQKHTHTFDIVYKKMIRTGNFLRELQHFNKFVDVVFLKAKLAEAFSVVKIVEIKIPILPAWNIAIFRLVYIVQQ